MPLLRKVISAFLIGISVLMFMVASYLVVVRLAGETQPAVFGWRMFVVATSLTCGVFQKNSEGVSGCLRTGKKDDCGLR
ncbi:MAG: hypothetical protein H0Z39_03315 [Peptococcaceae bacterium]|nr:hypothetical protein [Peptococcaceae bacterium]